jgi:hypothetical protein
MDNQEIIEFPGLPLAVYREIAAHLQQVEGIVVDLIPQTSLKFDYNQSQVSALCIKWSQNPSLTSQQRVKQILAYYQERYISQPKVSLS